MFSAPSKKQLAFAGLAGAVLLLVLIVLAVPMIGVVRDDPVAECAIKYDERKTTLVAAEWTWLPPGWSCRFTEGADGRVP